MKQIRRQWRCVRGHHHLTVIETDANREYVAPDTTCTQDDCDALVLERKVEDVEAP